MSEKNKKARVAVRLTDESFERLADRLARGFAPPIFHCKDCDHPVVKGYCCTFCGSQDPR